MYNTGRPRNRREDALQHTHSRMALLVFLAGRVASAEPSTTEKRTLGDKRPGEKSSLLFLPPQDITSKYPLCHGPSCRKQPTIGFNVKQLTFPLTSHKVLVTGQQAARRAPANHLVAASPPILEEQPPRKYLSCWPLVCLARFLGCHGLWADSCVPRLVPRSFHSFLAGHRIAG